MTFVFQRNYFLLEILSLNLSNNRIRSGGIYTANEISKFQIFQTKKSGRSRLLNSETQASFFESFRVFAITQFSTYISVSSNIFNLTQLKYKFHFYTSDIIH